MGQREQHHPPASADEQPQSKIMEDKAVYVRYPALDAACARRAAKRCTRRRVIRGQAGGAHACRVEMVMFYRLAPDVWKQLHGLPRRILYQVTRHRKSSGLPEP